MTYVSDSTNLCMNSLNEIYMLIHSVARKENRLVLYKIRDVYNAIYFIRSTVHGAGINLVKTAYVPKLRCCFGQKIQLQKQCDVHCRVTETRCPVLNILVALYESIDVPINAGY